MHSQVQKQYMDLFGKPVLYYALRQFEECEFIDEVILVTKKDEIAYCREEDCGSLSFAKGERYY